jgi:hypothetical protein
MDLSPADRLVIDKLLRKAKSEIRESRNQHSGRHRPALSNSLLNRSATPASESPIGGSKDKKPKLHQQRDPGVEAEWKKPWIESSGGLFGLGKS